MKFGVITFPGSNCDQDIIYVLRDILMQPVEELWHKDTDLKGCDFVILPGGFSYGDYLRSGAIARFSPVMNEVVKHANNGGYVMGICNGFQILCESGLLPGVLRHNENQKFICKNIYLKPETTSNIITENLDEYRAYKIPIAHAEGNYFATPEQMREIHDNEQVIFRYCNEEAEITSGSNPNGSLENIAGICNKSKNVFGMMPHPERAADFELTSTDGREIFDGMLKAALV